MRYSEPVRVTASGDHDLVELTGPLSPATVGDARGALARALTQRGRAVVDVSGLVVEWEPVVTLFATALSGAGGWPVARLVLFGAPPALRAALARARVLDTVPTVPDRATAVALLDVRPHRVGRHRDLPGEAASAAVARLYTEDACAEWEIAADPSSVAVQIVNELVSNAVEHAGTRVSNAVEHAGTRCRLTLALDARGLHVAVRDDDPYGAVGTTRVPPEALRGRGLHLVDVLSGGWGVTRHAEGKTVWAWLPI